MGRLTRHGLALLMACLIRSGPILLEKRLTKELLFYLSDVIEGLAI